VIRAYKYLFYKLCLFERIMFDPVSGLTGFCFMLALQFFNLFSLYLALNRLFGFSFASDGRLSTLPAASRCSPCRGLSLSR
jgi:hypothetical protein